MVSAKAFKTEKRYLSAKDDVTLDGQTLVIDAVFPEEIKGNDGSVKESLCIRFKGQEKLLSLNQTNLTVLSTAFGDNTDEWVSRKVKLNMVNVKFKNEVTKGIQVNPIL
jgi:hypothetical protein